MKLVIEIPECDYERIKEYYDALPDGGEVDAKIVYIAEGKPLPEGHGRLIDADVLCDYFWDNRSKLYTHKDLQIVIDEAPTIIEADKESAE